jgi:hypothetical protein
MNVSLEFERDARAQGQGYDLPETTTHAAELRQLLTSGGGEGLHPAPGESRNRHGTTPGPAPGEISFSSTSAATITSRGHQAAAAALVCLTSDRGDRRVSPATWVDSLRQRLLTLYGIEEAEAVFCASGVDAEFVALAIARGTTLRPLANILVASGDPARALAAGGRHAGPAAPLQGAVRSGRRLAGWEAADIEVHAIAARGAEGLLRAAEEVDRDAATAAMQALAEGRDVLLHVLDAGADGQPAISRDIARAIAAAAPGRVNIVVDACQLRCAPAALRADLAAGFIVMVTGSAFAGGPAFAGAVLIPPALGRRFSVGTPPPRGLAAYQATLDWPVRLRERLDRIFTCPANPGLGLRWEAALAELEAFAAIPLSLQAATFTNFARHVVAQVRARPWLALPDGVSARLPDGRPRTVLPILMRDDASEPAAMALRRALRTPLRGRAGAFATLCHLGAPLAVGAGAALPLAASAPLAITVVERMARGRTLQDAMAPVRDDIDLVFCKWDAVRRTRRIRDA